MYSTCELVVHMLLPIAYPILWFVCLHTCSYNALVAYSQQVATLRSTTLIFQFSVLFLFKLIFLFLGFACVFNFVCSSILYCTKFARKKSSIFFPPRHFLWQDSEMCMRSYHFLWSCSASHITVNLLLAQMSRSGNTHFYEVYLIL